MKKDQTMGVGPVYCDLYNSMCRKSRFLESAKQYTILNMRLNVTISHTSNVIIVIISVQRMLCVCVSSKTLNEMSHK